LTQGLAFTKTKQELYLLDEISHHKTRRSHLDGNNGHASHPYQPGYESISSAILNYIIENNLRPGDRLPTEADFASMFGVGRTVARDAVKILSALGRLSVRKGAGIFVAEPTNLLLNNWISHFLPTDLNQVSMFFEMRLAVETETARLAAERASPTEVLAITSAVEGCIRASEQDDFSAFRIYDEAFHHSVAVSSHNNFLVSLVVIITDMKRQILTIGLKSNGSGSLIEASTQHKSILNAIVSGNSEQAMFKMGNHIDISLKQYRQEIQRRMSLDRGAID